jgi:hypothetical protein
MPLRTAPGSCRRLAVARKGVEMDDGWICRCVSLNVLDDLGRKTTEDGDPDQDHVNQEEIPVGSVMTGETLPRRWVARRTGRIVKSPASS